MFKIDSNKTIYLTRGDIASIRISAKYSDGTDYIFKVNDVVRLKVFKRRDCNYVVLEKDTIVTEEGTTVDIVLNSQDTKIGEIINKDVDYWYEVSLNPDTAEQTIIGYNVVDGKVEETIFKLMPEGADIE